MKRRQFIQTAGMGMAMLGAHNVSGSWFVDRFVFKEIRNGVGYFTEAGGTIGWLQSKEGFVVVDAQFPHSAPHLIQQLRQRKGDPFHTLINTHHHADHTAGNIVFRDLVRTVVAHENSLSNQKRTTTDKSEEQFYPTETFRDRKQIKVGEENIILSHLGPAHTDGDAIVHFEQANVVHMGDLVFNRRFPYIDKSAGANIHSWITILDRLGKQYDQDTIFIFGHSLDPDKVTGRSADLQAFQNYLQCLLDFVSKGIKAGKTETDLLKTSHIPGAAEWKGEGIERSIQAAWAELHQS